MDHVDGHRTVALAISPYTRRGYVDSTFYSQTSMMKTIELILGLQPLTIFDRIANDMRASFQDKPDYTPYTSVEPKQSLYDLNPPLSSTTGAQRKATEASLKMRWDVPDANPEDQLNRIIWHQVRGWNVPYPTAPSRRLQDCCSGRFARRGRLIDRRCLAKPNRKGMGAELRLSAPLLNAAVYNVDIDLAIAASNHLLQKAYSPDQAVRF